MLEIKKFFGRVSFWNFMVGLLGFVLSTIISFLGYKLNTYLADQSEQSRRLEVDEAYVEMWSGIEGADKEIIRLHKKLGGEVADYMVAHTKVLEEMAKLERRGINVSISDNNVDLNVAIIGLTGRLAYVTGSVRDISNTYKMNVLKYQNLAEVLDLQGWKEYTALAPAFNTWELSIHKPIESLTRLINVALLQRYLSDDYLTELKIHSKKVIEGLAAQPPSVSKLVELQGFQLH